jgi:hypothetical protein
MMKQDLQNPGRSVAEKGEVRTKKENGKLCTVDLRFKVRRKIAVIIKGIRLGLLCKTMYSKLFHCNYY